MPQKKRNPDREDSASLGGYVDKEVVALFDADWHSYCAKCLAQGKPVPTRLQYLAKIVYEHLTSKPYEF